MRIKLELFGESRDFSNKDYLEFNINNHLSIEDFRNLILEFLDKKFKDNKNYKKIVNSSAFCSENNTLIKDNYKITKEQTIGIIPPIGGG